MKQTLRENLTRKREREGYTFYGLSKLTGIHQESLKRMERGQGNVKAVDLHALATLYKIKIDYFFTKRK